MQDRIELRIKNGHTDIVNGVMPTKDEKTLFSWSSDKTIRIWNRETDKSKTFQ